MISFAILSFMAVLSLSQPLSAKVAVTGLACEYLENPLAVGTPRPRLAWKMVESDSTVRSQRQLGYQILVATDPDKLSVGMADLWDSGEVASSNTSQIEYEGLVPDGCGIYYWKVRVKDRDGRFSDWSDVAFWGRNDRLSESQWIGDRPDQDLRSYLSYVADSCDNADFDDGRWRNPPVLSSPMLRKTFEAGRKVRRAVLYASAVGCYEMWLNGSRVGGNILAPEWTDYNDRLQYQAYDITPLVVEGNNAIAAVLSDGWALGRLAGVKWMKSFPHRGFYAADRRLIARLEIEFDDGNICAVPTDASWKINTDGYILSADNFAGETIDARRIPTGWTLPGFDDSAWDYVSVDSAVSRDLVAQPNEPIRPVREFTPERLWARDGKVMADFGQNIAGHCRLKVKGTRGDTVCIRHGEWLNGDGLLYTQSLGYADATDRFILSGGEDVFEPTMTYHGFQFVEISGLDDMPEDSCLVAVATASDVRPVGTFRCSDERLNKLYDNIVWTQRNNMQSVLTDNPSRDERTGAMGDIQIFAQSSIFNMDMAAFYTKYLYDMKMVADNGQFFSMVPSLRNPGKWGGWVGAPGWCEAAFILPWRMYENYGDTVALELLYSQMCRHIDSTLAENPDLIWRNRHNHNGDWLNANTVSPEVDPTYDTTRGATPDDLFATAFFAYSTRLLARISAVLGHSDSHSKYSALADRIRDAFVENFVAPDGSVQGDSQGAYSIALFFDLVPENLREKCFRKLLRCIEDYDTRLSTGFISTPMMMQLLRDFGRSDIAYRLLMSERFPSWLYIVRNGATTVWERWDAWTPDKGFQNPTMNSLDHVAFGAVSEWMFRNIIGINPDTERPGYKHFELKPCPGGGLEWAEGSYDSVAGRIKSSWNIKGNTTEYAFTVPANTEAVITIPAAVDDRLECTDGLKFEQCDKDSRRAVAGSGSYHIIVTKAAN